MVKSRRESSKRGLSPSITSQKKKVDNSTTALQPSRPVVLIEPSGLSELAPQDMNPANVGLKAYGLASMPDEWVPRFFVVSASCFVGGPSDAKIQELISQGISANLKNTDRVIVRSSGSLETARDRGQLVSKHCLPQQISEIIQELIKALPSNDKQPVHWIVQEVIPTLQLGHLSNERHLRKESRDWIAEVETFRGRPGYTVPFAIRRWRDGMDSSLDLNCTSELEISRKLRRVAMWGMRFTTRMHFEWVWDGRRIWMVQAEAADAASGTGPATLIPEHLPHVNVAALKLFRLAKETDYQKYHKLQNAKLYSDLGYRMPDFYVLDDPKEINSILSGTLPQSLNEDLNELTKRALILRTDGENIPDEMREMLPRSDVLSSAEAAGGWLLNGFRLKIEQSNLNNSRLCLIAHHFIPSVASAWAGAKPGSRIVRIESLWGIPEGLYWHAHDTFEVDTITVAVPDQLQDKDKYRIQDRLRYKGTFIAPDSEGNWIPHQTSRPFDWSSSIRLKKWIVEIAHTTRLVAERVGHPISLMWFLDNHPDATEHQVLPWFHSKSDVSGPIKAAPRRKFRSTTDSVIRSTADWKKLQDDLSNGRRIERVIVEPVDSQLIRNPQFALELGRLAADRKFVVELSGGILSHVFYILRREGAQVECKDLYGDEEDIVEYDKLVRDKIPALIEARGEYVQTLKLEGQALITSLQQKLVEEAYEAKDARSIADLVSELADIEEVIRALCKSVNVAGDDIKAAQEQKRKKRGGFDRGTMLIRTATPHSIQKQSEVKDARLVLTTAEHDEHVISNPADIPAKRTYRRPDLRQVAQQLEKMFTFETELNTIGNKQFESPLKQTLNFSLPIGAQTLNMTLAIELVRSGSSLRGVVRLRSGALQLTMEFPAPDNQLKIQFPEE
jgi:predicted house-cleaning noncanonical NTP pyrophosphatase (MazG superfamily)